MHLVKILLYSFLMLSVSGCATSDDTFDFFSVSRYVLPFIIALIVFHLTELYRRYKKSQKKSPFFTFGRFRTGLVALGMIAFTAFISLFISTEQSKSPEELLEFAAQTNNQQLELEALRIIHSLDPDNEIATYNYFSKLDSEHIDSFIEQYKKLNGHYFELACLNTLRLSFEKAAFYCISLDEKKPVVCFIKSQIALYNEDTTQFINYLLKEIENEGIKKEAYPLLAEYFTQTNQTELLYTLVKSDFTLKYLPYSVAGRVYYVHGDVARYISAVVLHIFQKLNWYSFLAALIILVAYTVFLRELDLFNKEKWSWIILMVLYGVISPFFLFPFSDFLEYNLGLNLQETVFSEFIYYTVNVGLTEEFVKLFPLFILLFFTKKLKEPYDYMLYTSLVAFGFAFTENLIYFTDKGIGIMQVRAMLSVPGHAIFASSVGYLLAFSRFKKKLAPPAVLLVFGLLLAALLHGMFDFLLASRMANVVVFIIYFLSLVHMWAIMLNNCMNNSSHFSFAALPRLKNFHFKAVVILLSIVLAEYLLTAISLGRNYAFHALLQFLYPGIYLILFLSNTLGRFDFFKNYWEPITPPYRELIFPRSANTNNYVGKHISIAPSTNNKLHALGELKATIVERKIYNGSTNWFLAQLIFPLVAIEGAHKQFLLIEFGADEASLDDEVNHECGVYLIPQNLSFEKIKIKGTIWNTGLAYLNISQKHT